MSLGDVTLSLSQVNQAYTTVSESAPTHVISATLPRRPAHHVTEDNQSESCVSSGITTKERHDMDALLRSVQDLDFSPAESDDKYVSAGYTSHSDN